MLTLPNLLFGSILAVACGALWHLLWGGPLKILVLYLVMSLVGFWLGQIIAQANSWLLYPIGGLLWLPAILGACLTLAIVRWFAQHPKLPNTQD